MKGILIGNESRVTIQGSGGYLAEVGGIVSQLSGASLSTLYIEDGSFAPAVVAQNHFSGRILFSSVPQSRIVIGGVAARPTGGQVRFNLVTGNINPGFSPRAVYRSTGFSEVLDLNASDAWGSIYGHKAHFNTSWQAISPWLSVSNNVFIREGSPVAAGGYYYSGCEWVPSNSGPVLICSPSADTGSSGIGLFSSQASTLPRNAAFGGFDSHFWDLSNAGYPSLKELPAD
jgi:hypothetical protein